ncbi:MAG: hypothetical protein KDC98_18815 [Planctomycetes bacterium]|nr:hypothetical protein [Planctomycetota bacterium]
MSDFLFAQPSTLSGTARIVDLGGVFDDYNTSATTEEADARALRADWQAVGADLSQAMESVREELDLA